MSFTSSPRKRFGRKSQSCGPAGRTVAQAPLRGGAASMALTLGGSCTSWKRTRFRGFKMLSALARLLRQLEEEVALPRRATPSPWEQKPRERWVRRPQRPARRWPQPPPAGVMLADPGAQGCWAGRSYGRKTRCRLVPEEALQVEAG
uniref:Uncharacterized protein n=1 Tax=Myotis myotis TaxID=51298 RepID=A0A7J7Z6Z7_MYOMY|nr:hypothetical protein mMyoMyo1_010792 [Myotis myotis]